MTIKKGYDNTTAWDKIQSQNLKTIKISQETQENNFINNNSMVTDDEDIVEFEEAERFFNDQEEDEKENFDEVLQLTQFEGGGLQTKSQSEFSVAEYRDIDVVGLEERHKKTAKVFVERITKFVLEFNDVVLSEEHKKYLKNVGNLQLEHLSDLLYLVDVNKQMLNNIIARVNATQAEDYAIINSYNNLTNQHLKLIKELQNTYKAIPTTLKKMKADILCNQELEENIENDEVITSEYGETQFNNSKSMMRNLLAEREKKKNQEINTE